MFSIYGRAPIVQLKIKVSFKKISWVDLSQVKVEEDKDCKNDWLSQLGLEPTRVAGGRPRAL